MEIKDGEIVKLDSVSAKLVERLGDRAKFNSRTNIEVRLAEVPKTEEDAVAYLNKVVDWATKYYDSVQATKDSGAKVNPRQIKKDTFTEVFGAVEAARPTRQVVTVRPTVPARPVQKEDLSPSLDTSALSERFDTFKADDLPDDSPAKSNDLPPLEDDEDALLGEAHVVGEDILKDAGVGLAEIDALGDGADIFD